MRRLLAIVVLASCNRGGGPAAPPAAIEKRALAIPMSDPAEYAIDHVSRDAGEEIFVRTGIGDPYRTGIPYPIFLALLRGYPELFGGDPQALAVRFGFVARAPDPASDDLDEREGLPVGMHLTEDPLTGVPFVVNACALCHAERLHWKGGEALVLGLGSKHVRIHDYDAAFVAVAGREDLTAARIADLADAAAAERDIPWPVQVRDDLVAGRLGALRQRAELRAPLVARTANGAPGRVAPIEAFAIMLAEATGREVAFADAVGWSKVPDVIGFGSRVTLSWDGVGEGPMDVLVVEADFAAGVRVEWFWSHPLQGASLGAYLRQPAPRPAFPGKVDARLAARGHTLFDDRCAPCHGTYGADGRSLDYEESVVDLEDIGTDPARALAPTPSFVEAANDPELTRGITRVRATGGYVPPILTNVWARAPYGHAGQWPSLAVIATPPAKRPTRSVLALDADYDLDAVGIPTRAPDDAPLAAGEYLQDGFSVAGHPFLADLGGDAAAVIEYLKTL
jgi:mono/diheme cytochrome c family protein